MALLTVQVNADQNYTYWAYIPNPPLNREVTGQILLYLFMSMNLIGSHGL